MKTLGIPFYWRDELKDILLEKGFDAVIEQIEEWIESCDLFEVDHK